MFNRGVLGIHEMIIGDGCKLKLGPTGSTRQVNTTETAGEYVFPVLTVKAGGEVTVTEDLVQTDSYLRMQVKKIAAQKHEIKFSLHFSLNNFNEFINCFIGWQAEDTRRWICSCGTS